MITLSLLKQLETAGLGQIDGDLFWQKIGLGKVGVYITDIGQAQTRGMRRVQRYELYSRGTSDVEGRERLERIVGYLNEAYDLCELPAVPGITENGYKNITIMPLSTPSSVGEDSTGRVIWSVTGEIVY